MSDAMSDLAELLERWGRSLCKEIAVGGLLARCPIAHKWRAPFHALIVREALFWRMHDLGQQILCLRRNGYVLGERILVRAALETFAIIVYLNAKIAGVLDGTVEFDDFEQSTKQLLMGSKNSTTRIAAVNILTALKHAEKRHPGIVSMHEHFSESSHPNYDGVLCGYSTTHPEEFEIRFSNQFEAMFGNEQGPAAAFLFVAFECEYNDVWPENFNQLEAWLRANDARLDASKHGI